MASPRKRSSEISAEIVELMRRRRLTFAFPETETASAVRHLLDKREQQLRANPLEAAIDGATFIADHFRQQTEDKKV